MNFETSYCYVCFKETRPFMRRLLRIIRHARTPALAARHVETLVRQGEAPQILYTFFFNRPPRSRFADVDWLHLVRHFARFGSGCIDIDTIPWAVSRGNKRQHPDPLSLERGNKGDARGPAAHL
jgi:hypothetical protein